MDSLHKLLRSTMAINRHPTQSMVAGSGHRWTQYPTYCDGQHVSVGSFASLLRLTTTTVCPLIRTFSGLLLR